MMAEAPSLLVPTTTVPVPPEIWRLLGYNNEMPHTGIDVVVTAGAHVALARLIRLDGVHGILVERVQEASRVVRGVTDRSCHGVEVRRRPRERCVLNRDIRNFVSDT